MDQSVPAESNLPRHFRRAGFVILLLVTALLCFAYLSRLRSSDVDLPVLSIGQPVDEVGTFEISETDIRLDVTEDPNGDRSITIWVPDNDLLALIGVAPRYKGSCSFGVYKGHSWFAAVDQYHGLWVCTARPDSVTPHVEAQGIRFDPVDGQLQRISEAVMVTGNWALVPAAFLERIHAEFDLDSIPQTPPEYTPEQIEKIQRYLE